MLSPLVVVVALMSALSFMVGPGGAEEFVGNITKCDHNVNGMVVAITKQKVEIREFTYDYQGPSTWFHGQLKDSTKITRFEALDVPLAFSKGGAEASCDRIPQLKEGDPPPAGPEIITVFLPKPISDFKSIGLLCYQFCAHFGSAIVSDALDVTKLADADESEKKCENTENPYYGKPCGNNATFIKHGNFDCSDPPPTTTEQPSNSSTNEPTSPTKPAPGPGGPESSGVRFTCFYDWFILPLILFAPAFKFQNEV